MTLAPCPIPEDLFYSQNLQGGGFSQHPTFCLTSLLLLPSRLPDTGIQGVIMVSMHNNSRTGAVI